MFLGLADARSVHEETTDETRSSSSPKLDPPHAKLGGDVVDERRNSGRAVSCRVECRASEKLVEGGARLLYVGHEVGHEAHPPGHPPKGRPRLPPSRIRPCSAPLRNGDENIAA